MQKNIKIKYHNGKVSFAFSNYYADGSVAISLHDANTGEAIATATICLVDYGMKPAETDVFIKDYSENAGMYEGLRAAGIVDEAIQKHSVGQYGATVYECSLTDEAVAEYKRQKALRGETVNVGV